MNEARLRVMAMRYWEKIFARRVVLWQSLALIWRQGSL